MESIYISLPCVGRVHDEHVRWAGEPAEGLPRPLLLRLQHQAHRRQGGRGSPRNPETPLSSFFLDRSTYHPQKSLTKLRLIQWKSVLKCFR